MKDGLFKLVDGYNYYVYDKFSVEDFFAELEMPAVAFGAFITIMTLTLAFFMMTASFSQKIREQAWESGVLRAIGITKDQNDRIFYYEASCIVVVALITGTVIGMVTTILTSTLLATMLEEPLETLYSMFELCLVILVICLGTFLAVRVPAKQMSQS